jgi:hypothetical protein
VSHLNDETKQVVFEKRTTSLVLFLKEREGPQQVFRFLQKENLKRQLTLKKETIS